MQRNDTCLLCPSVLLVATNHVGNNIFLTPAIRLLKKIYPEIRFDVVTMSPRGASVFEGNPAITKTHTVYHHLQMRRLVKNYPLVIGLHRVRALEYLQGTSVKSFIIGPESPDNHRAEHALEFVSGLLGCSLTDEDRPYALCPQPKHVQRVNELLQVVKPGECLVGLHLGNGRTTVQGWKFWYRDRDKDARLWPRENYIAMARLLQKDHPNIRFVLTGSSSESFLAHDFRRKIPGVIDLIGATSLLDLAALMARLDCFVTQDTGALHVACSSDVPVVGLFGPSNPTKTGPYPLRSRHTIMQKVCMDEITPDEVAAAVLDAVHHMREPAWMVTAV